MAENQYKDGKMRSVWDMSRLPGFPALSGNVKTDVLVIGGGMAGLLTAYMLREKGIDCIVAEKGRICSGNTAGTTAKITSQHGLIYHKIARSAGTDAAGQYLRANEAAVEKYAEMCGEIDCDFSRRDNYVYSVSDKKKLEDEMKVLGRIGYDAGFNDEVLLPVAAAGAVKFPRQAQFDPIKFAAAISRDLKIYENTWVREMEGNTAVTDGGRITAGAVVVATHFPFINKHGLYFLKLYQHRTYEIALENAPSVSGMYVDEDLNGLSFRESGDLLLLGGGGHRTGKKGGNFTELCDFAAKEYPSARVRYSWAAQDCMSLDGVPYIGRYSRGSAGLYVATGFNKWGMTGSMTSAMILSDMIAGKKNEYAEVFDPSRSMLKPQLLVNGFEAVTNLLTFSTKRCPHLGCTLKWNSAEHSWDCPCHGSRFSPEGKVLDNPANGNKKHGF